MEYKEWSTSPANPPGATTKGGIVSRSNLILCPTVFPLVQNPNLKTLKIFQKYFHFRIRNFIVCQIQYSRYQFILIGALLLICTEPEYV